MKIVGIIAEYNPFHDMHAYHIEETRKHAGKDAAVVCVMSGDFVQRGEAAVFSKFLRAETAVLGGVDLVLELPLPWCMSSAEGFARGGVGLLGALGCVDYLSFGAECEDLKMLSAIATMLMDPQLDASIAEELKTGVSYAAARQAAISRDIGSLSQVLEEPNNILAVEYLKAIYQQRLRIEPLAVRREGPGHDKAGGSASDIRRLLALEKPIKEYVPHNCWKLYKKEKELGRGPVTAESLELPLLSRLRMKKNADFALIPDDAEGLSQKLCDAAHEESSFDGVLAAAKSKRYAMARLRRMCMYAALGIRAGDADGIPPYARVLAANDRGRAALRIMQDKSHIPILTKPATVRNLDDESKRVFVLNSDAHDFYVLGYSAMEERRGNADWRTSPRML